MRRDHWSILVAVLLILAFGPRSAAGQDIPSILVAKTKVSASADRTRYTIHAEMVDVNNKSLTLEKSHLYPIYEEAGKTAYLGFPKAYNMAVISETGKPELPYVVVDVEIPPDVTCSLGGTATKLVRELTEVDVAPVRAPIPDTPGAVTPPLAPDAAVYGANRFYPGYLSGVLGSRSEIRGTTTQRVILYPFQYNPKLRIVHQFDLDSTVFLAFEGATPEASWKAAEELKAESYSSAFALPTLSILPDYRAPARPLTGPEADVQRGCNYLIITADELAQALNPLIQRKRTQPAEPLVVKMVKLSELGITASTNADTRRRLISQRIVKEYQLSPRPTYLLLVGNAKAIPPYYKRSHPAYPNEKIATDLYYGTVVGPDLVPELFTGRLPADTADDLRVMVAKIVNYEKAVDSAQAKPWGEAMIAADYENFLSGQESHTTRWFHQTAYNVGEFLAHKQTDTFTTVKQIYVAANPNLPQPWFNVDGTTIPSTVMADFTSPSSATKAIGQEWSKQTRLILHRDHGGRTGWYMPGFHIGDVQALPTAKDAPVVFSINCETGWFDHASNQSFAQSLMRSPGGASAVLAASRISYSKYNDRFTEGLIKGIWNFEFDFLLPEVLEIKRVGPVVAFGKTHLMKSYSDTQTDITLELFNLFGDPDMQILPRPGPRPEALEAASHLIPRRVEFPSSFVSPRN